MKKGDLVKHRHFLDFKGILLKREERSSPAHEFDPQLTFGYKRIMWKVFWFCHPFGIEPYIDLTEESTLENME